MRRGSPISGGRSSHGGLPYSMGECEKLAASKTGWLAGWLADWLAELLSGWLAGWLARWLAGLLAGWLAGWLTGSLARWQAGWAEHMVLTNIVGWPDGLQQIYREGVKTWKNLLTHSQGRQPGVSHYASQFC